MSESLKIVLTATLTILGGVTVLVFGEIVTKFFIEPIHELSKLRGEIADSLVFYANVYSSAGTSKKEYMDEASSVLRRQAAQLRARAETVPWYRLWELLHVVPGRANIAEASAGLIGLSNIVYESGAPLVSVRYRNTIVEALGIKLAE
jgi:hypothetical protein